MSDWVAAVILIVLSGLFLLLGVLVIVRNARSLVNRFFLGIATASSFWIITNAFFPLVGDNSAFAYALLSYSAALLTSTFMLQFCLAFAGYRPRWSIFFVGVFVSLLSLLPGVLATEVVGHQIITTPWLYLYTIALSGNFLASVGVLGHMRKKARGSERSRVDFVMFSLAVSAAVGVFFNLVLPIFHRYEFVQFGPAGAVFFVSGFAVAIIRHQLFNIKSFAIRGLIYLGLLIAGGALYIWLIFNVGGSLITRFGLERYTQTLYAIVTFLIALSFQPLKRAFDRITDKIFFQDAYDTEDVLDGLSTLIVGTIDLQRLMQGSSQILRDALGSEYAQIIIEHRRLRRNFCIGEGACPTDIGPLMKVAESMKPQYAAVDELFGERDKSLKQRMDKENVAVIISLKTHEEHLGHLYLGYKRNGNMYTKRDLDMIKIAADQISIALQNGLRFEEIQEFNITLQKRVDEATYQLRQSNKKLQALDEAKDEFISMASHQLRTPLTSVKGYLSMVIEGDAGKLRNDQRSLLNEAYASAERMVYLISDFLNVSRIRTGKFVLESKMSNLADVITGEIGQLAVSAHNRNLELHYDAPSDFPLAYIDQDKIRQVIMNFIDNAIYYTPAGGKINVQLTVQNKEIVFKVADTGIGVPADERHKLFTKFYRATNARKIRPDGTGIGLFMAKKVVTMHGGSIIFESMPNKGSTFGFRIPITKEPKAKK